MKINKLGILLLILTFSFNNLLGKCIHTSHLETQSALEIDIVRQAKEEINQTTLLWDPIFYVSVQGVYQIGSNVAMYGGAYVLLESPKLVIDLVKGGFYKAIPTIGKDYFLNLIENAVETPNIICKNLSRQLIKDGLNDYKIAYDIVKKARKNKSLSEEDANEFMKRRWGVRKLMIARTLYNETIEAKYSISNIVSKKVIRDLFDKYDKEYQKFLGIDNTLPLTNAAFFIKDVADILNEKRIGLMAYEPYLNFVSQMEILNKALMNETENENVEIVNSRIVEGLVAYYPLNGNANDESGKNNDGVASNLTPTTDRFDKPYSAFYFNGRNSQIDCGDGPSLQISGDITVAAWVKLLPTEEQLIVQKYYGRSNDRGWVLSTVHKGQIQFDGRDGRGQYLSSEGKTNIHDNQWHFLVGQRKVSTWSIFVDGTLSSINDVGYANSILQRGNLIIGAGSVMAHPHALGIIDDVRIYNRAISDLEIQSLFHENGWK